MERHRQLNSVVIKGLVGQSHSARCLGIDSSSSLPISECLGLLGVTLSEGKQGIFDWEIATGRIVLDNKTLEVLGLSVNESPCKIDDLVRRFHPADRALAKVSLEDHLSGRTEFFEAEIRFRSRAGNYHWILVRGKALRDSNGNANRLVGLNTDINARKLTELLLRENEEWLRGAVEGSFDAIQILRSKRDENGTIVDFEMLELNRRAEEHIGLDRSKLLGKLLSSINPNYLTNGEFEKYVDVVESRSAFDEERVETSASNGSRWFHVQGVPVADGISLTLSDITNRKESERVLLENQEFIEKLAQSLPEFVYVVDLEESAISYQNRDFLADLGYPAGMFSKGMLSIGDLIHSEDAKAYHEHRNAIRDSYEDDVIEMTCRIRTVENEWRWIQIRSVVFRRNEERRPIEIIRSIHDVSAQMQSELELREKVRQLRLVQTELRERQEQLESFNQRLAALATTDGLTGLYNYRAFHEKLDEEARRSRRYDYPLAVVLADVDDFKAYNDRFGHPAGDERLRQFGKMLLEDSRDSDFVARYGGEEFAMILINTNAVDAARYAQRLVDKLNKESGYRQLTASFGCVQLEPRDKSIDDLIQRADECLYSAKRQGKNRVVVCANESTGISKTIY